MTIKIGSDLPVRGTQTGLPVRGTQTGLPVRGTQTGKIGTNIFMAPMSGCSDLAFRLIAREHGAKLCFFEMADSNSIVHNHKKTLGIFKTTPEDSPIAAQLLGSDPQMMLDAAQITLKIAKVAFIDVNGACPVRKVISKKAGAYLLQDRPRLFAILKKLSNALSVPITLKMRLGYGREARGETLEIAKGAENSGAAAVFIHGRLGVEGYDGKVDYGSIKAVKEALGIPVFGAGNVLSGALAKRMFDSTGCDGIIVARGALGNPWIFEEIESYLKTGHFAGKPSLKERKETLKKHLSYIDAYKPGEPSNKLGFMRKVVLWYTKGFRRAAKVREKAVKSRSYDELLASIEKGEYTGNL